MDLYAAVVLISWYALCVEQRQCLSRDSTPTSCSEGCSVQAPSVDIVCWCILSVTVCTMCHVSGWHFAWNCCGVLPGQIKEQPVLFVGTSGRAELSTTVQYIKQYQNWSLCVPATSGHCPIYRVGFLWRFKSSGMWHSSFGTHVLRFWSVVVPSCSVSSSATTSWHWTWRHHYPSKRPELFTQRQFVTCQKN